jgi:hypothetical protein
MFGLADFGNRRPAGTRRKAHRESRVAAHDQAQIPMWCRGEWRLTVWVSARVGFHLSPASTARAPRITFSSAICSAPFSGTTESTARLASAGL